MRPDRDIARDVRLRLSEPVALVGALGLADGAGRQVGGVLIRCPWHAERSPSCSVTIGRDHTIRVHCFACGAGGDALSLVAVVRALDVRRDFPKVLAEAAALAGLSLDASPTTAPTPSVRAGDRPPADEVAAVWAAAARVDRTIAYPDDLELAVAGFLARRRLWPADLAALDVARVLPLPAAFEWPTWWPRRWAAWRLAALAYEPDGRVGSLHARAVTEAVPKTRWPLGCRSAGLLFADTRGLALLRGAACDVEAVIIGEGLTDFLSLAVAVAEAGLRLAVLGAASGGFSALARVRWPRGRPGIVAVDCDRAGEGYAREIRAALPGVELRRWKPREAA